MDISHTKYMKTTRLTRLAITLIAAFAFIFIPYHVGMLIGPRTPNMHETLIWVVGLIDIVFIAGALIVVLAFITSMYKWIMNGDY